MTYTKAHADQNAAMLRQAKAALKKISLNPDAYTAADFKAIAADIVTNYPDVKRIRINNRIAQAVRQIRYDY